MAFKAEFRILFAKFFSSQFSLFLCYSISYLFWYLLLKFRCSYWSNYHKHQHREQKTNVLAANSNGWVKIRSLNVITFFRWYYITANNCRLCSTCRVSIMRTIFQHSLYNTVIASARNESVNCNLLMGCLRWRTRWSTKKPIRKKMILFPRPISLYNLRWWCKQSIILFYCISL